MDNDNLMGLRTSCDRCRAQKLRCVPSSKTDPTAPCQRCSRSKEPRACVFSQRLRTGRQKKSPADKGQLPRKTKATFAQTLPGMSTFTLSTSVSRESSVVADTDTPGSSGTPTPRMQVEERETAASVGSTQDESIMTGGLWDHDDGLLDPALVFASSLSSYPEELCTDMEMGLGAFLGVGNLLPTPPDTMNTTDSLPEFTLVETPDRPGGPLVDLASMLPIMSRYECQLQEYGGELDNYPIGDALFLAQRFHAVLSSQCHCLPSPHPRVQMDMPTKLLTLSCYMILTRIYSFIFGYMHQYLGKLPHTHALHDHSGPAGVGLGLFMEDVHAYRGLRLGQLQQTCICVGCKAATRTKKAVSMLLDSLGSVEGALGLPPDVRVIGETSTEGWMTPNRNRRDRTLLLDEGLMAGLTNGRLHKTVREQVRELRATIEEVEDLLKDFMT